MQMNRYRYVEKEDEINKLERQIIKINLNIQEIKQELTYIEITTK